jgi:hypothetical protein
MGDNCMMATAVVKVGFPRFLGCNRNQVGLTFQIFNGSNAMLDSVLN